MSGAARIVSAEELAHTPGSRYRELVRGVPQVREPPGGVHGRLAGTVAARLHQHVERLGLGTVLVEAGYVVRRAPDTVRGPDVSFLSRARLSPDQLPEQFIPGAPDLAVEIVSPAERWAEVEEKVADYFAGGARLVWIVEPRGRRVTVRYPDRPPRVLTAGQAIEGEDVVPGFMLPVAELFRPG